MPSLPRRREAQADLKKGCPTKITVGSAMAPEIQWKRSRVAASAPDQTATERSITFIIEKKATPTLPGTKPALPNKKSGKGPPPL